MHILAALQATPPPFHWSWSTEPDAVTLSAIASLTMAAVLDYFGIGPAKVADRLAAGFAVAGFAHLTFDGKGQLGRQALEGMNANAVWAAFITDLLGFVALACLIGMMLPKNEERFGRFTRFEFRRRKSNSRFNVNVWIWPALVSLFPMSAGLVALLTHPLLALVVNLFTGLTFIMLGY